MRFLTCLLIALTGPALADAPRVVVDIGPVGALVARIMQDVGEPTVLVRQGASPHDYAMRPSDARALAKADLVVWIGPQLTGWLEGPVAALAEEAHEIRLLDVPNATVLDMRDGVGFDAHDHGDEEGHNEEHSEEAGHDDGHEAGHKDDHATGHDDHEAEHKDEHAAGHDDQHGQQDPHMWLDPLNAAVWAKSFAVTLAEIDPDNAGKYSANYDDFIIEIRNLELEVKQILEQSMARRFVTLHDSLHYFEDRFDVSAFAAIYDANENEPSVARMAALANILKEAKVSCVVTEPQVNARLVGALDALQGIKTVNVKIMGDEGVPLSARYPAMIRTLATQMAGCLSPS